MNAKTHSKSPHQRYLIQILVDHSSPDAFFGWIDKGAAPHISKYILGEKTKDGGYSKATISRNIVTGYPSTSANSHTSIITGSYARKNNILYTIFWNLSGKKPIYTNVERMALSSLKKMNSTHINPSCKTLFEYFDDSASFHAIYRGASFKLFTNKTILFTFLPLLLRINKRMKQPGKEPMEMPEFWKEILDNYVAKFLKRILKKGNAPKASFLVYLLTDELGHHYGFDSEEYKIAIQYLDYLIQIMIEGLMDNKGIHIPGLKEQGYLESIIWNFCTDHAARAIHRDKLIFVNTIAKMELGLNIIEGEQPEIEALLSKGKMDYATINGFSIIGSELWHCWMGEAKEANLSEFSRFHGESFFRKVNTKIRLSETPEGPIDLIKFLTQQPYVQFVIVPEEAPGLQKSEIFNDKKRFTDMIPRIYEIKIFSSSGSGIIKRSLKGDQIEYTYEIVERKDPLNYDKLNIQYGTPHNSTKWLELTLKHELPDLFHRLFGFFDSIYAPNLVVTSSEDYHFLPYTKVVDKKERAIRDIQTHDGLYGMESMVPLTLSGPGIKKGMVITQGRNIDVLPTILKAMGIEPDKEKIDGIILDDALE